MQTESNAGSFEGLARAAMAASARKAEQAKKLDSWCDTTDLTADQVLELVNAVRVFRGRKPVRSITIAGMGDHDKAKCC